MKEIKALAAERDLQAQKLADLKTAAQAAVNMVDPVVGGGAGDRSLVEQLHDAPQKLELIAFVKLPPSIVVPSL
jgi:hypothetical protein